MEFIFFYFIQEWSLFRNRRVTKRGMKIAPSYGDAARGNICPEQVAYTRPRRHRAYGTKEQREGVPRLLKAK
jgi:hypothetical protein